MPKAEVREILTNQCAIGLAGNVTERLALRLIRLAHLIRGARRTSAVEIETCGGGSCEAISLILPS
jgi:hypothetical protein